MFELFSFFAGRPAGRDTLLGCLLIMTAMMMRRYMPHALMVLAQLFFTLLYFIAEAAFNRGLNSFVYVTYRHLLAACILCPFAYFKEK